MANKHGNTRQAITLDAIHTINRPSDPFAASKREFSRAVEEIKVHIMDSGKPRLEVGELDVGALQAYADDLCKQAGLCTNPLPNEAVTT